MALAQPLSRRVLWTCLILVGYPPRMLPIGWECDTRSHVAPLSFSSLLTENSQINSPDTLTNYLPFLLRHFYIQQNPGQNTMAQNTQSITFGGNNAQCGNIINSFNTGGPDENSEIMRWLSPLEPNIRHQGVRAGRFGSVGGWLFETSEFREWRDGEGGGDKAVLFCSGNPGVGKTYLRYLAGL